MSLDLSQPYRRPDHRKLGVLVIGRKRPGWDQEWNRTMRGACLDALGALGYEPVGADEPVMDDATIAGALAQIRAADCRGLVVLQPSLGNGQLALTVAQQWPHATVLWATPERQETKTASSCSLVAQHLWASIFRQAGQPFELVYGDPRGQDVREPLRRAIDLTRAAAAVRAGKLGLVGSQPPGYLAMAVDAIDVRRRLGAQIQQLSLPQFADRVAEIDAADIEADLGRVREMGLKMRDVEEADLETQSRIYVALRQLVVEERLDALTLQEWPEMPNLIGQWPYLALARLSGEGLPMSMEGDADGALCCLAAARAGVGDGFITDWLEHDDRVITFWHPGTAPLSMIRPGEAALSMHFNIQKPMVVDGPIDAEGGVTVARLWHCDGAYHLTAFEGQTVAPRRELTGNSLFVELDGGGVNDWFDELCHAGVPHHPIVFPGRHADAFRRLARLLGLGWLGRPASR